MGWRKTVALGRDVDLHTRYSHGLYTWLLRIRQAGLQAEPTHFQVEAPTSKSEDARGFGDVPRSGRQSGGNQVALNALDDGCQVPRLDRHASRSNAASGGRRARLRRRQVRRQMFRLDHPARWAQRHGTLNLVAQLTNITRPPVARKQIEGRRAEMHVRLAKPLARVAQKEGAQMRHLLTAFAQWRHV